MKILSLPLILSFLLSPLILINSTEAQAEISSIADAINKSGRQRMLTQRILSSYYQVGKLISVTKSKKQLNEAIELFGSQLKELEEYEQSDAIIELQKKKSINLKDRLHKVSILWERVKDITEEEVMRSRAEDLHHLSEALLKASHKVVLDLQSLSDHDAGELINISGRQRMLVLRLSSLYILKSWGFDNPKYKEAYTQTILDYRTALNKLKASPFTTKKIDNALFKIEKYFKMFENSHSMTVSAPSMIRRTADRMVIMMEAVTKFYQIQVEIADLYSL